MPRTEVLFYQERAGGQVLVEEWLQALPSKVQDKCLAYLSQLEDFGHELRRPIVDYLRDGIYELRPSYQGVHYRMLYFFYDPDKGKKGKAKVQPQVVVVSHGLTKERDVPEMHIGRAIERRKKFEGDPRSHTFRPTLGR